KARRQVELPPEILLRACKDGLGAPAIPMQALGNLQDAPQVGAGAAVSAVLLDLLQLCAHQVLHQDAFLAMRLVLRRLRLVVEADGARFGVLKAGEIADDFTRE